MSRRSLRRSSWFASSLAVAFLLLTAPMARAHGGGGGHGGGGQGGGHASSGVAHASGSGRPSGYHGGGGSSSQASSYVDTPLTFNPYDLPSARLHRYLQHLFHHDGPTHS